LNPVLSGGQGRKRVNKIERAGRHSQFGNDFLSKRKETVLLGILHNFLALVGGRHTSIKQTYNAIFQQNSTYERALRASMIGCS